MDKHALEYYIPYSKKDSQGHFHRVIDLNTDQKISWSEASKLSPHLGKGWYELSHLSNQDRVDFTKEFWLSKLPYHSMLDEFLNKFFSGIDDIAVFLTQRTYDDKFEAEMIYSLSGNSGFYRGYAPAKENEIIALQKVFTDYILPSDYLAFLQVHNGFAKLTDTGITKSSEMENSYQEFQRMLEKEFPLSTSSGDPVNPKSLIPFYKSFGMEFYQCFWGEWYPEQEMGTVYYSSTTKTILTSKKQDDFVETMAFKTFTDWLMFYLEKIT